MSHRLVISPEDYSGDAEPLSPVSCWCATVTVGQTPATSTCQRGLMSLGLTTPRLRCMLAAMSVSVQNVYIYMYIYIHIAHQVNFPEAAACQSSPAVQLQTNCVEAGLCQSGWQSLPTFLPTESRRPSSNEIAEGSRAVSHFRNVMYACQMYVSLCGCACWHDL